MSNLFKWEENLFQKGLLDLVSMKNIGKRLRERSPSEKGLRSRVGVVEGHHVSL